MEILGTEWACPREIFEDSLKLKIWRVNTYCNKMERKENSQFLVISVWILLNVKFLIYCVLIGARGQSIWEYSRLRHHWRSVHRHRVASPPPRSWMIPATTFPHGMLVYTLLAKRLDCTRLHANWWRTQSRNSTRRNVKLDQKNKTILKLHEILNLELFVNYTKCVWKSVCKIIEYCCYLQLSSWSNLSSIGASMDDTHSIYDWGGSFWLERWKAAAW